MRIREITAILVLCFLCICYLLCGCNTAQKKITFPQLSNEDKKEIKDFLKEWLNEDPGTTATLPGTVKPDGTKPDGSDSGSTSGITDAPAQGAGSTTSPDPDAGNNNIPNGSTDTSMQGMPDLPDYEGLNREDFDQCEMIPTYEQMMECKIELPIKVNGTSLEWDASKLDLSASGEEEVKAVNVWYKDNTAILFKDWGADSGCDERWFCNDDLRKDKKTINALQIPGAHFVCCIVATLQPVGLGRVSRVIARSRVVTNG